MRGFLVWLRAPGRLAALAVFAVAVAIYYAQPYLLAELQHRGFDAMQRQWPYVPEGSRVTIVDVDEDSLKREGQWPWPRTVIARLFDRVADAKPLVFGVDVFFAEPDRLSPQLLPKYLPGLPSSVAEALATMPSGDSSIAAAIARMPTVLGMGPTNEPPQPGPSAPRKAVPIVQVGIEAQPFLPHYRSMVRSLPEIARSAQSEASVGTVADSDGLVRSIPLLSVSEEKLVPAFGLEVLRTATGGGPITVQNEKYGVRSIGLRSGNKLIVPTDSYGRAYIHFEPPLARYVSAADLLDDNPDLSALHNRIVLFGVSGLGLLDQKMTPLGPMFGTEIHAQLIESMLAGVVLQRSRAASGAEVLLLLAAGLIVISILPYGRPAIAVPGLVLALATLIGTELVLFLTAGWLVDGLYPTGIALLGFGAMLGGNFIEEQRANRQLEAELAREREAKARLAGELKAAHDIQMGLLPLHFPAFPERREVDVYARIEPARNVGGDLFDFLFIDRNRLFFMIGDVSGKGIPAALFMAMTKEVVRGAAVQHGGALDRLLSAANQKIAAASDHLAEDGADMMFVTAFAGCLDLASGEIAYASAGHDSPMVISDGHTLRELTTEGGPPLGMVADFPYPVSRDRLEPGAILLLYTDGVTEAQDAAGALYGGERLTNCLSGTPADNAQAAIDRVFDDVRRFVGEAEQFDDITLLAVRRVAGLNGVLRAE